MASVLDACKAPVLYIWHWVKAIKPPFVSKHPHFSFITAHYFWIVGMTIVASIAIYAGGRGETKYIDSLMFASGANTQAGLNPLNLNEINTFQQVVIYLFAMISCPITLHGSVVLLRLYWFEKRFQGLARDAKERRRTLTRTKSKSRTELPQSEVGVNGRHITIVTPTGEGRRLTNDGMVLQSEKADHAKNIPNSDESDTTATMTNDRNNSMDIDPLAIPKEQISPSDAPPTTTDNERQPQWNFATDDYFNSQKIDDPPAHSAITFADTVKRSDGINDDLTKFSQRRATNAEHIAILERQRNQDNEVLRIPGPRDAERGLGPRRLDENDANDDDDYTIRMARTLDSRLDHGTTESRTATGRPAAITIEEPARRRRDEVAENVSALGNTLDTFRLRKPRIFNRGQKTIHEDGEDTHSLSAVRSRTLGTIRSVLSRDKEPDMPYLSYTPTLGRNSNFIGLSLEEREELGGIEYRSLRTLLLVLVSYFWGFQLLAVVFLVPYIKENRYYGNIVRSDGVGTSWWGIWTANSAFMDLGFTLTPDSMNSFNTSAYVLMIMWFFIIIGNTGFPVMLRFCIWVSSLLAPKGTGIWEELQFLLDHPRRCFTLLFPSGANWWLFWILVLLNAIDLLFFIVLDLGWGPVSELPVHTRIVDGLFQAASTRTAGFSCLNLSSLHPAMPVLYMIMMYISVFPIAISIRRTNVYEEKSLGVYEENRDEDEELGEQNASAFSYVGTHLRRQLSFDLWYVFLGFFILAITEGRKIQAKEFDMFDILFEIVSAYGTVGLSMGTPRTDASLCSQFSVVGKLVIIAMQIRGRHRGLPYGLDRAVLLPSECPKETEEAVEEDGGPAGRIRSNATGFSISSGGGIRRRRGSSAGPSRAGRGEGLERTNSHLITQFLHPGPIIPREVLHVSHHPHRRTKSVDFGSEKWESRRPQTQPRDNEAFEGLAPLPNISHRTTTRRRDSLPIV